MALIRKPAGEGDVGEGEIRGQEELLGSTDPDPPQVLADRAPKVTVKLAAHLDGVPRVRSGGPGRGGATAESLRERRCSRGRIQGGAPGRGARSRGGRGRLSSGTRVRGGPRGAMPTRSGSHRDGPWACVRPRPTRGERASPPPEGIVRRTESSSHGARPPGGNARSREGRDRPPGCALTSGLPPGCRRSSPARGNGEGDTTRPRIRPRRPHGSRLDDPENPP
jgi:hypothetical protein